MKRKISLILATIILLTTIPSNTFAEKGQDKGLKEAILRSKELFNIGIEYDKFDQSINTVNKTTIFNLNWSDKEDKLGSINLSITMDGTVLSYNKWEPSYGEQEIKLPSISKEEGLEIANDFIKKASPKLSDKIKYQDRSELLNINSDSYSYDFIRIENDLPYYNNNISVSVDNSTGQVKNYNANWDMDLTLIDTKNIITLEKAKSLYKEKIGLDLIYKSTYEKGEPKIFLVYAPLNKNLGINAKDGELGLIQRGYGIYESTKDMAVEERAGTPELSPEEEKAIEEISSLIPKEEAEKIAREILELDEEYNLTSINLFKSRKNDDEYNWMMSFEKKADENNFYASISINAKTKKLLNFFKDRPTNEDEKVKLNKEQSLNLAKEFIKKFNQDNYNQIELRENPIDTNHKEEKQYNFDFIRKIDNAYVEEDGISINVDAVNGKIKQYRLNWNNKEFSSKDNIISLDKAYDALFNEIELELKYVDDIYDEKSKDKKEAMLVYGLKNDIPGNIDPISGLVLNDNGKVYDEPKITHYKDIGNSYAKDKINILAQYGIALSGENFKPKEKIIQKDFLYLLLKSKDSYYGIEDSEDDLYRQLIYMGIIKEEEKSPEKIVTKEEAVKYLIRSLNYGKVADLDHIYKDIFTDSKDISPELKGYISIAYGLEIIQGYNGNLNPKVELKREDGANMIYNLLFNGN